MEGKNKINPISLQSKEWIMSSLLRLLSKKQFNEITITEISSEAQLARRTFYRNFSSKEEVLDLYIEKLIIEYIDLLKKEEILDVYNMAKVFFTFGKSHMDFVSLMDKNNLLYLILQKYMEKLPMIHKMFKADKEYGNDEMLEYVLSFSAGGFWNMLIKWIRDGAKKSPYEMASLVNIILSKNLL